MKVRQHMTTMVVTACIAAIAVPAASAMTGGKAGDAVSRYVANHSGPGFITDTLAPGDAVSRYVANHGDPASGTGVRFITDTLAPGGGGTVAVSTGDDGVSWWDTGVGFSAAVVLFGLVFGARTLFQRRGLIEA
jgi:hypothetical protein